MSRLTASPFHKPSPFVFPPTHAPPSPPETQLDTIAPALYTSHTIPPFSSQDYGPIDTALATGSPDTSGSRFKRLGGSSLPYHSSGIRDSKERSTPRSAAKALIVVIPPPPLVQDYSRLGHASHVGASNRLSQGVVMPLCPSLFGQLSAIAKEFNFPSTTGLCLYFHHVEDGITMTPRISDESWQAIWAYLSEPTPSSGRRLIAGKMEFDVDLRLARWYSSWVSAVHREYTEQLGHYHPSTAPSLAHFRADSRTTMADGRPIIEEDGNESLFRQQHSAPAGRHVPRKLSLVERFDVAPARPEPRGSVLSASPQEVPTSGPHVLTTIMQEDEPKTAKEHLDSRVKSWRASALTAPSPLAASGQTSLDPPNLPNNMDIATSSTPISEEEFRLEDFAWSVTSAGPMSCGEISPVSWSRVSSVGLANRAAGSVCSTPSYYTSNGPLSSGETSPISWSAVSSVHLADRLEGSVCSTQSYRTSFGPSDYDPLSPTWSHAYPAIPTPDVARRFIESIPSTPGTATTWGAPLSYPPSPRCASPVPSVDLGARLRLDELEPPLPHYPRPAEGESAPSTEDKVLTQKVVDVWSEKPWSHVWPYTQKSQAAATSRPAGWAKVDVARVIGKAGAVQEESEPDPTPLTSESRIKAQMVLDTWNERPWSHVWPYTQKSQAAATSRPAGWEKVDVARVVGNAGAVQEESEPNSTSLTSESRVMAQMVLDTWNERPWSHVWPYNKSRTESKTAATPALKASSVWNKVKVTDVVSKAVISEPAGREKNDTIFGYPYLRIYEPVYPHFDIYPSTPGTVDAGSKSNKAAGKPLGSSMKDVFVYPAFDLYPAVYPYNLTNIYPSVAKPAELYEPQTVYPYFNIYPAAKSPYNAYLSLYISTPRSQYPAFEIYPTTMSHAQKVNSSGRTTNPSTVASEGSLSQYVHLHVYPALNIYPAVYPFFDLYPAVTTVPNNVTTDFVDRPLSQTDYLKVAIAPVYPSFNLYPRVYPFLDIYPGPYFPSEASRHAVDSRQCSSVSDSKSQNPVDESKARYPFFNIYPAVYPHFDLYLSKLEAPVIPRLETRRKTKSSSRLTHSELHAMVMMERIGSTVSFTDSQPRLRLRRQNSSLPTLSSNSYNDVGYSSRLDGFRRSLSLSLPNQSGDLRRPSRAGSFLPGTEQQVGAGLTKKFSSLRERAPEPTRSSSTHTVRHSVSHKRDSLVLQRAKAYDSTVVESPALPLPPLPREPLSRFPMPPRSFPPLPPIPIDRESE